jgi:hypothetical protein
MDHISNDLYLFFINTEPICPTSSGKTWTKHEVKKWFKQKAWLNGLSLTPHKTINQAEFGRQYHLNKILLG